MRANAARQRHAYRLRTARRWERRAALRARLSRDAVL